MPVWAFCRFPTGAWLTVFGVRGFLLVFPPGKLTAAIQQTAKVEISSLLPGCALTADHAGPEPGGMSHGRVMEGSRMSRGRVMGGLTADHAGPDDRVDKVEAGLGD